MVELDPITEFREDHRKVRDGLLGLADALESKNIGKAGEILGELNNLLGPHFRFEEEALYPALRRFLGEYVDELLKEHDGAIEAAKELARLIGKGEIGDDEAKEAASKTRALLVHVSNCDGLAILAERLDAAEIQNLGRKFAEIRDEGIPLLDWAEKIRKKGS
jgi:hypothetical protein